MNNRYLSLLRLSGCILSFALGVSSDAATIDDFRAAADKANAQLTIPQWDQTPEAVATSVKEAIATANKRLDEIGAQDPKKVTFKSTVAALDDVGYEATNAANKATIIKET